MNSDMTLIFGVFGNGLRKNNALLPAFLQSYMTKNSENKLGLNQEDSIKIERIFPVISPISPSTFMPTMLGWGRKKSHRRATKFAQRHGLAMLTLEDGFLRSLTSGKASRYACSMVIDPIGIYFNAKYPSYLEQLIAECDLDSEQIQNAQRLIQRITDERLSKYNGTHWQNTLTDLAIDNQKKNILLIDQVAGDQSIAGAGADNESFANMLEVAQNGLSNTLHPDTQLWIKAHPAGKVGYLTKLNIPTNIHIIGQAVNPIELLEHMDEVYTVSSHMGFEALMLGKTVHCFGVPWYAGWGMTDDRYAPQNVLAVAQKRRGKARQKQGLPSATLQDLFFTCYLQYTHYANPATAKACPIDTAIDWLVTNRAWKYRALQGNDNLQDKPLLVYQMSGWKTGFVTAFFASSGRKLQFKAKPKLNATARVLSQFSNPFSPMQLNNFPQILVWGFAKKQEVQSLLKNSAKPEIWCMEDGFIRSNGLGASLIEPLSVVVDKTGIYYDATTPSDLENLLANKQDLSTSELQRVKNLQQCLIAQQVSKYNVGEPKPLVMPKSANEKYKILVVGQVEDDLSIQRCASDIKTNLGLLQAVRFAHPDAFIWYKPHPDVQAGLRIGKIADTDMAKYADQIVLDSRMPDCLEKIDSVHTISSLTGFEALLRGKNVVCYGLPFYAGWGLTADKADNAIAQKTLQRRKFFRDKNLIPLTLEQLIFATLIDYPLYRLPNGFGLAQVEEVIDYLYASLDKNADNQNQGFILPKNVSQAKKLVKNHAKSLIKKHKPQLTTKFMQLRHQIAFLNAKKR